MPRKKYKLPENAKEDANDNYTHKYIYELHNIHKCKEAAWKRWVHKCSSSSQRLHSLTHKKDQLKSVLLIENWSCQPATYGKPRCDHVCQIMSREKFIEDTYPS